MYAVCTYKCVCMYVSIPKIIENRTNNNSSSNNQTNQPTNQQTGVVRCACQKQGIAFLSASATTFLIWRFLFYLRRLLSVWIPYNPLFVLELGKNIVRGRKARGVVFVGIQFKLFHIMTCSEELHRMNVPETYRAIEERI